jgi:hypothetical protein
VKSSLGVPGFVGICRGLENWWKRMDRKFVSDNRAAKEDDPIIGYH